MRHIVTLSLVFFSLTHLAKAERVEGLRIITEKYCNKQQVDTDLIISCPNRLDESRFPFFLSYSELTLIGVIPGSSIAKYYSGNHVIADLTIRKKPKNNSP